MWNKKDYDRRRPHGYYLRDQKVKTNKKGRIVVNGVEYQQINEKDPIWTSLYSSGTKLEAHQDYWCAVDGTKRVIVGPEKLVDCLGFEDEYFYVSALGDYYRGDYCIWKFGEWVSINNSKQYDYSTFVIHTDESGFIENMLLHGPKPVGKLEKMQFKLKDLVEAEKGKKLTVHDQIKWFKDHPTVELLYGSDEKERHERMSKILRAYPKEADL